VLALANLVALVFIVLQAVVLQPIVQLITIALLKLRISQLILALPVGFPPCLVLSAHGSVLIVPLVTIVLVELLPRFVLQAGIILIKQLEMYLIALHVNLVLLVLQQLWL
jgi:hypothetical protein|tara:strand:+ start:360 stop:689 length:330 start_codon:yes stop_codon:yes gene_type:complete